ncbi:MAG TPA: hypothetical protein VGN97_06800 [Mesorhizobium sp.]|jgi:hypothetical protein|nr:hypothetical protein [Mesorhizobium sp.]
MREHHHSWPGQVPVGEGLVAALMSIMDPSEAETFLSDYLNHQGAADDRARNAFCFRVRAMADWLRREEQPRRGHTLQ